MKPNIILIVIDALRARNLGCYGKEGEPSPHIDNLAKKSTLFKNAYSCWNTTDQSLTSILSGKYPRSHGIMNHGDRVTTEEQHRLTQTNTKLLAELLKNSGYHTYAVDWMGRWFKRGFDYYGYEINRTGWDKIVYNLTTLPKLYINYMLGHLPILKCYQPKRKPTINDLGKGLKDVLKTFAFTFHLAKLQDAQFVTRIASDLLHQKQSQPFFMFLHYWDTHTPYHCPVSYLNKNRKFPDSKSLLKAKYQGAVKYVDFQLGNLFSTLKNYKLWEDTLLIITSDHGDSLTEHDIFFDHHGLYDETTHVPLIIHYPPIFPSGKRIEAFVQHIDIVPTICDLLNIKYIPAQFNGQSLLPLIQGRINKIREHVFCEESYVQKKSALRTRKYKYIRAIDGEGWCNYCQKVHVGKEELYDLDHDPQEIRDIAQTNIPVANRMKAQLLNMINNLDKERENNILKNKRNDNAEITKSDSDDDLIRKRFKNLGY